MAEKNKKRRWGIGRTILVVLLGLVIGFMGWFLYTGSPKEIIAVADQFKPGSEWKLTQNDVEPPRNFCIDVVCPSVNRTWETSDPITKQDFEAAIKESGWNMRFKNGCFEAQDISRASCWAHGISNGYNITLYAANDGPFSSKPTLQLTVED